MVGRDETLFIYKIRVFRTEQRNGNSMEYVSLLIYNLEVTLPNIQIRNIQQYPTSRHFYLG